MAPEINPASPLPDLSQCEAEPIHIPGSIQPHGVLLALHGPVLRITQATPTCESLLGVAVADLLERDLETVLGPVLDQAVREALARYRELPTAPTSFSWQPPVGDRVFTGYVHESDPLVVLELEPAPAATSGLTNALAQARRGVNRVRAQAELPAKAQTAAEWLRRLTGYDRVMIYRFDEDWHGEVIAEARRADLEPYLGLHYPASDIPAQARRLYLINPMRVIVDVDYAPSPLLPAVNPVSGQPLDLSSSLLRSVSPVHLEYLRNMGVRATLVASLLRTGQLWGLIACHHYTPLSVAGEIRQIAGWMAQDLATQIALTEEIRSRRYGAQLKQCRDNIFSAMRQGARLPALVSGPELADVLGAIGAEGVALIRDAKVITGGVTPDPQRILEIAAGLSAPLPNGPPILFATDCLSAHLAGTADLAATAAGVAVFSRDATQSINLIWFRGEQLRHVTWGGNPDKAITLAPDGRLSPRQSFAAWTQRVRLHSIRWSAEELESVRELGALIDIVEWRRMTEDALRDSEERLQRVLEGANDGFWDWNMVTGEHQINHRWAEMLGYELAEIEPHVRSWEQRVHPDDLPHCRAAMQAHLSGEAPRYLSEHRLRAKNGEWRWILSRAKVTGRDAQGQPLRMAGTHTDITDRRLIEEALCDTLVRVQRHDEQMTALNRMNDLLLSCETREEAHAIIAHSAKTLFAPYAGGLAVGTGTASELRVVATWGDPGSLSPFFSLRDCWALRRGELHEVEPARNEIDCQHFPDRPPPTYLCVPLNVRGKTLGLLHVSAGEALTEDPLQELRTLAITVSESIKLALSNIQLQEALRDRN